MEEYWAVPYVPGRWRVKSPLRYPGGKFYALKHIMPYIECAAHDEYREPFLGGGSVFFAKKKAQYNILNDFEPELINFYRVILDDEMRQELIRRFDSEVASRERHSQVKQMQPVTPLERAFRTYYLNRTSYCGIINAPAWGYAVGKSSPPENWGRFLEDAAEKLRGAELSALDYAEILRLPARGRRVLTYLDPPYYHADQKRAYTKPFTPEEHLRLANDLQQYEHLFCLSYDDCEEIRTLYAWARIYDVSWLYNTANSSGGKRKACRELIITNYDVRHT